MTAHQHWHSQDERIAWNNFSRFLMTGTPFTPEAVNRVTDMARKAGTEDNEVGEEGDYADCLVDSRHTLMNIISALPEESHETLRKAVDTVTRNCRAVYRDALEGNKFAAPVFAG